MNEKVTQTLCSYQKPTFLLMSYYQEHIFTKE